MYLVSTHSLQLFVKLDANKGQKWGGFIGH